jgi:uncharacterized protein (DUF4415 family)
MNTVDRVQQTIAALDALPDEAIDTSDLPPIGPDAVAQRGRLYRPVKVSVSIRIDADVVEFFKDRTGNAGGYQTAINAALRKHMAQSMASQSPAS